MNLTVHSLKIFKVQIICIKQLVYNAGTFKIIVEKKKQLFWNQNFIKRHQKFVDNFFLCCWVIIVVYIHDYNKMCRNYIQLHKYKKKTKSWKFWCFAYKCFNDIEMTETTLKIDWNFNPTNCPYFTNLHQLFWNRIGIKKLAMFAALIQYLNWRIQDSTR